MPAPARLLLAALLLACLGVAAFVAFSAGDVAPEGGGNGTTTSDENPNAPMLEGAPSTGAAPTPARDVDPTRTDAESNGGILRGMLVVRDAEGEAHTQESGTFTIDVRTRAGRFESFVRVEKGRFSVEASQPLGIDVADLKIGGRMACATWEEIPVTPGEDVLVEAWWPLPSVLHVEDEETGRPMTGLTLVQADRFDDTRLHPSEGWQERLVAEDLDSPVTLPDRDGTPTWYVRAAGYAWGHVAVDHRVGGEHRVALRRGGDLEVHFSGALPGKNAWLVARDRSAARDRAEWDHLEFRLAGHEPVIIEGLPPGPYWIRALGGRYRGNRVATPELAEARIEVRSGERSSITLELAPSPDVRTVPLSGVLRTHARRGPTPLFLWVTTEDPAAPRRMIIIEAKQLKADPKQPGFLRWSAGEITTGTWTVTVMPVAVSATFEVGNDGLEDAVVAVPEICELRVKVVDARDDAITTGIEVDFTRGAKMRSRGSFAWDPEQAVWIAHVPVGKLRVEAAGPLFREAERELTASSGSNELTLLLEHTESVTLRFREGETVVPIDKIRYPQLYDEDGEDQTDLWFDRGSQQLHVRAPGPGRYRLVVPTPDGYRKIPDRSLDLARGQHLELTIQLKRRD